MAEIMIRGAQAIAKAIGEHRGAIPSLVELEGLPAGQKNGKGPWRALPEDLAEWLRGQRLKHTPASHPSLGA